jgi:ubiquinone biosynthesis protein
MTRLGPSYVKMGQFLATRPDVVGVGIARELELLQDRMPPFPQREAEEVVSTALDRPLTEIFDEFSESVAAASIAQVHKARLKGSDDYVAVKVIRPGVRVRMGRDLNAMRFVARVIDRFGGREAQRFHAPDVVETIARAIFFEMDMRFEAAALSELAENTKDDPDFRVPVPYWDYTAGPVLTAEWIDGIRLSDLDALDAAGCDRPKLARVMLQSFLRHAVRDGFFHADMHPGNLFVDAAGNLVAVDFGIMGRLSAKNRRYLGEILHGFIARDYRRVAEVHFEAGWVPADQSVDNFTQALRAVGEPIHNRTAEEFSMARVLTLLLDITSLFNMHARTELVMLQKTMVVVEGVTRTLDPKINIWKTSEPIVSEWLVKEFGPEGAVQRLGHGMKTLLEVVEELPEAARRYINLIEEMERARRAAALPASTETDEKHHVPTGATVALWVIALALVVLAVGAL